jgi:hypothetical protein
MNPFGPKDIATPQIEEERLPVRERHKFRTLSLLGQTIKIKATEFLPGVRNTHAETGLDYIATGAELAVSAN